MQTSKIKEDWNDRILDYLSARNINNGTTTREVTANVEEIRRKEKKKKIISEMINNSPETVLLKLIYKYSPPTTPTPAVNILCQRIAERAKDLDMLSLEEAEEYHFLVSERRMHERESALEMPDTSIQQPAAN